MLSSSMNQANITMTEVAKRLGTYKSYISNIISGKTYKDREFYNQLYTLLESYGADVPRCGDYVLYPSGKAIGSWDFYVRDRYVMTWVFYNMDDCYNFLYQKDGRLETFLSFETPATRFDNYVKEL